MKHILTSGNLEKEIQVFPVFKASEIKAFIVAWLHANKTDTVTHEKELNATDSKKYAGNEILNFYEINPKNNKVSKVVTKGNKDYYQSIE